MKVILGKKWQVDIVKEAKKLAKEKGVKIKDIGMVRLTHHNWGIALSVWHKDGSFITNEAC